MLHEILKAVVCTDGSKQVKGAKTSHEKLMTHRSQMGWTRRESSVSLPAVVGIRIMKS